MMILLLTLPGIPFVVLFSENKALLSFVTPFCVHVCVCVCVYVHVLTNHPVDFALYFLLFFSYFVVS